jgi:hypothetical protein
MEVAGKYWNAILLLSFFCRWLATREREERISASGMNAAHARAQMPQAYRP